MNEALRLLGFFLGGEVGARAATRLTMQVSPDTRGKRVRVLLCRDCAAEAGLPDRYA